MRRERAWWGWVWVGVLVASVRRAHTQQSPLVLAFSSELNGRLDVKNVERCARAAVSFLVVHPLSILILPTAHDFRRLHPQP